MGKESPLAELRLLSSLFPYSLKSPSSECGFSQPPLLQGSWEPAVPWSVSPSQWHPQGELVPVLS